MIPSVEDSIRIKRERLEEEAQDEIVEESGSEGEDGTVDETLVELLDQGLGQVLVEYQDEHEVSGEGLDEIKLEVEEEDQQQEAVEEETEGEGEEGEEEQEVEVEVEASEDDEEDEDENSPEPDDSDDPDYYDPYDIEKTPVPIEVLLGTARRAPSGVKRKAQEMEDKEPQQAVSLKKPAWVQVVSPVPNPHLRQQAEQLQTVRKWYKEGGSRNPVILE